YSDAVFAQPLDDGTAVLLERSMERTGRWLGEDADNWRRLHQPMSDHWEALAGDILDPIGIPRHPLLMARFGVRAMMSVERICRLSFRGTRAAALFAGSAAHSGLPLHKLGTAAYGIMLN